MDTKEARREMWRSAIIAPPNSDSETALEVVRLVVCSEDRDLAIFMSPSRYDVDLPEEFNNVHSIELSMSMFRFSAYQINVYNNQLRSTIGLTALTALTALPLGELNALRSLWKTRSC